MQVEINFCNRKENNQESQQILEANKDRINGQVRQVLELLQSGVRLTVKEALLTYDISHLPRRIADLKEFHGIEVKKELINGRFKVYYL